ncbi:hypothetical protein FQR65_LT19270 [Abscondita terminalis]|nr:hypothetical protein FQR65_LT19270 [Abscondita terminalis]
MAKYELLPQQLLYEGVVEEQFIEPDFPDLKSIYAVHDKTYVTDFINLNLDARAARKNAALMALNDGLRLNCGGTHHAFPIAEEAFCMLTTQL